MFTFMRYGVGRKRDVVISQVRGMAANLLRGS